MTKKPYTVTATHHEKGTDQSFDLQGYLILGVVADNEDGQFAGALTVENVDALQIARMFDMLIEREPAVLAAFEMLRGVTTERKVFDGTTPEGREEALRFYDEKRQEKTEETAPETETIFGKVDPDDPFLRMIKDRLSHHDLEDPADTRFRIVDGGKTDEKEEER